MAWGSWIQSPLLTWCLSSLQVFSLGSSGVLSVRFSLVLILSSRGVSTMNLLPSGPQCQLVLAATQALTSFLIQSPPWPCFLVLSPFLRNPSSSSRTGSPTSHLPSSPRLMNAGLVSAYRQLCDR